MAVLSCVVGFTPLGPGGAEGNTAKEWQLPAQNNNWDIGYNLGGDIGAPVAADEAYRFNIPVITYGFDEAFMQFFGTNGVKAVDAAMRIFNDLPSVNSMSDELSEFPLNSSHLHHEAAQLGLLDLKSVTMLAILEELGLTDSIRWTFALRQRVNINPGNFGFYTVIKNNYDPVTLSASSYVNGTLWTYFIYEVPPPVMYSDAVEVFPPSVNQPLNIPVSALGGATFGIPSPIFSGYYFDGLTRDDVGGLRYLYTPKRIVGETLLAGVTPGGGQPWAPYLGTNFLTNAVVGTNAVGTNTLTAGKRGGMNKFRFQKVHYDTQFFVPFAQTYKDKVVFQGEVFEQTVQRTVAVPDILFSATDLSPAVYARTTTANWINNEALNGLFLNGGPGVISPPIFVSFSKQLPALFNNTPFFVTEPVITDTNARPFFGFNYTWASFDGTTNPPIIYPQYLNYTIDTVRNAARGNGL